MTRFVKRANGPWHWATDCPDYPNGEAGEVREGVGLPAGASRCAWCLEHEAALDDQVRHPRRVERDDDDESRANRAG